MTPTTQKYLKERLNQIARKRLDEGFVTPLEEREKRQLFAEGRFEVVEEFGNYRVYFEGERERRESYKEHCNKITAEKIALMDEIMLSGEESKILSALKAFAEGS